jgi:hypothetical protein
VMYEKATVFQDLESDQKIENSTSQDEIQALGRTIKAYCHEALFKLRRNIGGSLSGGRNGCLMGIISSSRARRN